MTSYINLPGLDGSDHDHWQSRWERADPSIGRFAPASWTEPRLEDWIAALDRAIDAAAEPPVLIAHSLACLLVPIWAARRPRPVRAVVLVALPDPDGPLFPDVVSEFRPLPEGPLPFPTLVIGSDDDRYGSAEHARARATQWHAAYVGMGRLGHINNDSGLGDWPEGRAVVDSFVAGLGQARRFEAGASAGR